MGQVDFDFVADNPGNWLFHCHNVYHMESGMVREVRYVP
jgi:FtsP/CotA-like multicopper oxidase with cupredoxin domain